MSEPTATPSEADLMAAIRACAESATISISRVGGRFWGVSLEQNRIGAWRFWGTSPQLHEALGACLADAAKRGLVIKTQGAASAPPITPDDRLARRLAQALLDVLDGVPDHHIEDQTSASASEVPSVIEARREARALLGLEARTW